MSNFYCEKCGKAILEGPDGHYVTGCEHYPRENRFKCPICKSKGFEPSITGKGCTFCDGTEGGNPPTKEGDKEMTEDYKTLKSFYIAGVQFHELRNILDDLKVNDHLELVLEPSNKYDPNATRIEHWNFDEGETTMCGYVPKKFSAEVNALIAIGTPLECVIVELNKNAKPWEMCKVDIREV